MRDAHYNLSDAFDYYVSVGDTDRVVEIAVFPFPIMLGRSLPTGRLVVKALDIVPEDSLEAGRLHSFHGSIQAMAEGNYQSARNSLDRALTIARREGNVALEMRTLDNVARAALWHQNYKKQRYGRRISCCRHRPAQRGHRPVLRVHKCDHVGRDAEEAQRQTIAILEPAEQLRDRYWLASAFHSIACRHSLQGDWTLAREMNQAGLDLMPMDERLLIQQVNLEIQVGDRVQSEIYLERLEEVVRNSGPGPTTGNSCLALVSPLARSIFGRVKRPSLGEASVKAV